MAVANSNFDVLKATTRKYIDSKLADNLSASNVFWKYLKMKDKVVVDGGESLVQPLVYGDGNSDFYDGSQTMTISKPEGISAAEFNWKHIYGTVTLEYTEMVKNMGEQQIINLAEARTKQAEMTIDNKLGNAFYGDGTGSGGKAVLGLAAIVDTDPTTGILGGIDRSVAANAFWRNYTNASVGSFASGGLSAISTAIRTLTRGSDRPKVIITGNTIYGYIQKEARAGAQYLNPELAKLGFTALKIEGIDTVYDPQCPADRLYLLNTDYLKLIINKNDNFKTGKFIEPADQGIEVAKIRASLQLVASNCLLQGVLSGFSA